MFTKGTLRYTALAAANILVGALAYFKPELVTQTIFEYVLIGNFLIAGADIIKHAKNIVKPS